MSRGKNLFGYAVGMLSLVLVLIFLWGTTVSGQGENHQAMEQALVREELQVAKDMRGVLGEAGFANSGINITHVVDELGNRAYSVKIHHQDFTKMDEEAALQLRGKLSGIFAKNNQLGNFAHQVVFF